MEWLERVAGIRRWTRGGERDPHRALLLLFGLGYFQRQGPQPMHFRDIEALIGCTALTPLGGFPAPDQRDIDWHTRQVFRSRARFS